ncbi:transcriptional regulator [Mesorhizobium denitrificans]|nr:transcriptional regulator [Mesorhizobium denitrificans]
METDRLTLKEFLAKWKLCRASYYNLRKYGRAPRDMLIGNKIFISKQAEADWIAANERDHGAQAA